MTIRNLFNIILKVFGLFFIKDIVLLLPHLLNTFIYLRENMGYEFAVYNFVNVVILAFVYGFVANAFIFKTEKIIDKLKIERDFDQKEITLNMHRSAILSIAIIVIGGLILVDSIPSILWNLHNYIDKRATAMDVIKGYQRNMLLDGFNIILGLLLIYFNRPLVNWIELKRKS